MQRVVCLLGIDPSDGKAIPVYVIKQREEARRATGRIGNRHIKLFKGDIVEPTKVTNDDVCQCVWNNITMTVNTTWRNTSTLKKQILSIDIPVNQRNFLNETNVIFQEGNVNKDGNEAIDPYTPNCLRVYPF